MDEIEQNQTQTKNNSRLVFNEEGKAQFVMDSKILEMVRTGRNTALSLQNIFAQLEDVLISSSEELAIQRSVSVELATRIKSLEEQLAVRDNLIKELQNNNKPKLTEVDENEIIDEEVVVEEVE